MGMKKAAGMYEMMALMANQSQIDYSDSARRKLKSKPKKKIIPKGLKEFFYGTKSVFAINQKNADRKAHKKGLIIDSVVMPNESLGTVLGE